MSCLLFFSLWRCKKVPMCHIYISIYMHTHTFSCRPHSLLFRAREPLRVERLDGTRRCPWHAHGHAVISQQALTPLFAHPSLTTDLCTSQLASRARATGTRAASSRWWLWLLLWGRKNAKPYFLEPLRIWGLNCVLALITSFITSTQTR